MADKVLGHFIDKIGRGPMRCSHHYGPERYLGKTGGMCFSYNCARPQIAFEKTCLKCGLVVTETYMSPLESYDLSPEVCSQILDTEFITDDYSRT